jgi:hypothetical protein
MRFITSHGFEFGVETENTHNEDLTYEASLKVQNALDTMGIERVAAIHANQTAVAGGVEDDFSDDYNDVCAAACLVSAYEDFIVTLKAC